MAYFSNGTEGLDYREKWCERCIHYPECQVWWVHLVYNYEPKNSIGRHILDMLIPIDDDGFPDKCKMFKSGDEK